MEVGLEMKYHRDGAISVVPQVPGGPLSQHGTPFMGVVSLEGYVVLGYGGTRKLGYP